MTCLWNVARLMLHSVTQRNASAGGRGKVVKKPSWKSVMHKRLQHESEGGGGPYKIVGGGGGQSREAAE